MRFSPVLIGFALATTSLTAPLEIPGWVDIDLSPTGVVERGRPSEWVLEVRAQFGPVPLAAPTLEVRGGRVLTGPEPARAQTLAAGEVARWSWQVTLPTGDAAPLLEAKFRGSCPRPALAKEVRRRYADARPAAMQGLLNRILSLPENQVLRASATSGATAFEGASRAAGPAYQGYTPAGPAGERYAYWKPAAPRGQGAARAALRDASPRLRALLSRAGVEAGPVDRTTEYLALVADFEGGLASPVLGAAAENLAEEAEAGQPRLAYAARMLAILVAAQSGLLDAAEAGLHALKTAGEDRVYAWYNLAEVLRTQGEDASAAAAYEQALRIRPGYTRARERRKELP